MNNNTNNLPVIFNYEGKQVRTVNIDGDIWLVAKDVCDILEHSNHRMAVQDLDQDEKGVSNVYTPGGMQEMTVINEAGLYKLTFKSRKPKAKEFTRWVTHEVLPEIMRTGSYTHPDIAKTENVPAPIPRDIKVYLSKANFSAQERIINRAIDVKYLIDKNGVNDDTDKECQKVLALDIAFKARTGYSALNSAGISIEADTNGQADTYLNWCRINWISHYKVVFHNSRLVLPAPKSEEHVLSE